MIPSKLFNPGRTKNVIGVLFPKLSKKRPEILCVIFALPVAEATLNGVFTGMVLVARDGDMKFLFAPVSIKKCNLSPFFVKYSMYGTLEVRHLP